MPRESFSNYLNGEVKLDAWQRLLYRAVYRKNRGETIPEPLQLVEITWTL